MKFLQENGYTVTKEFHPGETYHLKESTFKTHPFNFYSVKGKGIVAAFCTPNKNSYRDLNGRIAADREDLFDKWSKCPIVIKINKDRYQEILVYLSYLNTEEGWSKSNSFESIIFE